ncbi:glutathione peroxidase [Chitinophagales bacterium]|nr:glutathione peroxidase [Chitinophagales bacterium]
MAETIYSYKVNSLAGKEISLNDYAGKVVMIVNTATACGLTPQLNGLEELHKKYGEQGLVVLGVPSNDFADQEPLDGDAIAEYCSINHGVSFQLTEKTTVKGEKAHPLFQFLSSKKLNGVVGSVPKWNFQKYLIRKNGELETYFYPVTSPTAGRVKRKIEKLLAE